MSLTAEQIFRIKLESGKILYLAESQESLHWEETLAKAGYFTLEAVTEIVQDCHLKDLIKAEMKSGYQFALGPRKIIVEPYVGNPILEYVI